MKTVWNGDIDGHPCGRIPSFRRNSDDRKQQGRDCSSRSNILILTQVCLWSCGGGGVPSSGFYDAAINPCRAFIYKKYAKWACKQERKRIPWWSLNWSPTGSFRKALKKAVCVVSRAPVTQPPRNGMLWEALLQSIIKDTNMPHRFATLRYKWVSPPSRSRGNTTLPSSDTHLNLPHWIVTLLKEKDDLKLNYHRVVRQLSISQAFQTALLIRCTVCKPSKTSCYVWVGQRLGSVNTARNPIS